MKLITRIFSQALVLTVFCVLIANGQAPRCDGNVWQDFPEELKTMFVTGMYEGMYLGHNFTIWKTLKDTPKGKSNPALTSALQSYEKYAAYFLNVTTGQIIAGVDDFYKDYQNRRILIRDAVWIVLNKIAGTPKETIESMIENFKKSSGRIIQ